MRAENQILSALPSADWVSLRPDAEYLELPAGHTLIAPGGAVASVYFPNSGLVSMVGVLRSGHHIAVGTTGREGFIGAGAVLDVHQSAYWVVVQLASSGYRVPAAAFRRLFEKSAALRQLSLAHVGRLLVELAQSANCNRFHSHRQRLARWLLVSMDKSGESSFPLTHDFAAQMLGGPRHAVTTALNKLNDAGAVDHHRGRIDVRDRRALIASACECYVPARPTNELTWGPP